MTRRHGDWAKLSRMAIEKLQAALAGYFVPWVQALELRVGQAGGDGVRVRLPQRAQLARAAGLVCGRAMMAAADTCRVLALMQHRGRIQTVHQGAGEFRLSQAAGGTGWFAQTRLLRAGKRPAFGEIAIRGANDQRSVCRATTIHALL